MRSGPAAPLVAAYDGLILDADGVLYRGARAVDHAVDVLHRLRSDFGTSWVVVTNNAASTAEQVAARLRKFGIEIEPEQVITSPQGAVRYLVQCAVPPGSAVMVIGGPGIDAAVREAGFAPVRDRRDDPVAVVQGFGPDIGWSDLAEAAYAVQAGALWVATNADLTLPTAEGVAPGNGSLVGAVANAVGRAPDAITGKPEPLLLQLAAERLGSRRPLVVGDRIDTDIRGGNRAGMDTLLVLTGVTDAERAAGLVDAPEEDRPSHLAQDLRALLEPAGQSGIAGAGAGSSGDTDALARIRLTLGRAWAH